MVARLDRVARKTFNGVVYRHYSASHQALSGDGARRAGGRWNPPESFPVVYAALDTDTVDREFLRSMQRAGMPLTSVRPRRRATISVQLSRVLDLTDADVLATLEIAATDLTGDDVTLSQRLGGAAHHLGFEAIVAPSATGTGIVLAFFLDNRAADSVVDVTDVDEEYTPRIH